ncbi:heavy metal translocating P-type ATPase [Lacisediminihabitans sp. H27-G8]|uniref:heavy metal translocating P-type ATPase n=1 Tax=Lacisediminihabitans sp. H27-G8 TaxID=3111909 RepID=UPI0038FCF144
MPRHPDRPRNPLRAVLGFGRRYPVVSLTVFVGIVGMIFWFFGQVDITRWLFSIFALAVAAIEAVEMAKQLRKGIVGIDILAIVAIVATVLVGEFFASIIIVLMVSGGRALEDFAQGRARRELDALLDREPQVAHRTHADSDDIDDIPAGEVVVGDLILVRSGEVVPVDGQLVSASAAFDESSLTGESLPVTRVAGETVLSGSVNGVTATTIVATALARDSQFQAIVALVEAASSNRAPVVRLADRYAIPFTVISLLIGAVAWFVSGDPVRFAEVLVLATPCPLVLAAPVAFMGGMSRAAHHGIIVKGGGVLETLARVRTAVFDKTGTLTIGAPTVTRILPREPWNETQLLARVASAERFSSHVLAASLVASAEDRGLVLPSAENAVEVAAQGVSATIDGQRIEIGTLAFAAAAAPGVEAVDLAAGELAIYIAIGGRFAGVVVASDPVRDNAHSTIEQLGMLGVHETVMLTGDANATAAHVASAVGISQFTADCLPIDKVAAVRDIAARPVLMIGDGVNDAPVLAAADVGIAMGARGATAASESAAAVILIDDISVVALAVRIGQDTVRIALQSIWLGIALSIGLMLIAAFGVIPATLGAGIQEVVDLATILNALRAIRPKEHTERAQPALVIPTPQKEHSHE